MYSSSSYITFDWVASLRILTIYYCWQSVQLRTLERSLIHPMSTFTQPCKIISLTTGHGAFLICDILRIFLSCTVMQWYNHWRIAEQMFKSDRWAHAQAKRKVQAFLNSKIAKGNLRLNFMTKETAKMRQPASGPGIFLTAQSSNFVSSSDLQLLSTLTRPALIMRWSILSFLEYTMTSLCPLSESPTLGYALS